MPLSALASTRCLACLEVKSPCLVLGLLLGREVRLTHHVSCAIHQSHNDTCFIFFTNPHLLSSSSSSFLCSGAPIFFPSVRRRLKPATCNPRRLDGKPHRSKLDTTRVKEEEASPEEGRRSFAGPEKRKEEDASTNPCKGRRSFARGRKKRRSRGRRRKQVGG
ncbi:hypothetical protein ACLB2K_041678 [Fragaria x ananassa]